MIIFIKYGVKGNPNYLKKQVLKVDYPPDRDRDLNSKGFIEAL